MSIEIRTYRDPYQLRNENYWDEIKSCPYFCASQTAVNGLKRTYPNDFMSGRVTTVQRLISSLFSSWESTACLIRQHADIDNIITNSFPLQMEPETQSNVVKALRFNRDDVFHSLRIMFELDVNLEEIRMDQLTDEQRVIVEIYRKILCTDKAKDFILAKRLDIEQIDRAIGRAMSEAKEASNTGSDIVLSEIEQERIVIHGVHQFSPILLRAIEEISEYKRVILLFHYQPQYKNVYQTWFDIYTAFDCPIVDSECLEFHPDQALASYKSNLLADNLGKLIEGKLDQLSCDGRIEIIEFDNMTEFAGYAARVFEEAKNVDAANPMSKMREQIYSANGAVNDILRIYFPEQFGERKFLDYPLGHFFLAKEIIHTHNPEREIFMYRSGTNCVPILQAIRDQTARLLFISPEALTTNLGFTAAIHEANTKRYLKNIIIDEAHIVVDWGASFRVDYQCLESWRRNLLSTNPGIRTILLSATYEKRCIDILRDFFSQDRKWIEIRCDSLRHEPRFLCVWNRSAEEKRKRALELVRKLPHPMIIYVAKPDEAEEIKETLKQEGIKNVQTYTGLTNGNKREELIRLWADDQLEIMVATSAFGIGVDKPDIRTVLHLYISQNPNAYYQELGRGGRDRLPCLSVMCVDQADQAASFQRINKRVMTVDKIIGRWDSMYNSVTSKRIQNRILIDATVKPNYNMAEDIFEDTSATDADMNWNIYVLLLLRRFNLIHICEVMNNSGKYVFLIEIVDDALRTDTEERIACVERIREREWDYFNTAYKLVGIFVVMLAVQFASRDVGGTGNGRLSDAALDLYCAEMIECHQTSPPIVSS